MAEEGFKRKLTAILSADVEGSSRLMGDDEDATIRILTVYSHGKHHRSHDIQIVINQNN